MSAFSRTTIFEAIDALKLDEHAKIDEFAYRFGIEEALAGVLGGVRPKLMALKAFLIDNPSWKGPKGSGLAFEIIEYVLQEKLKPWKYETEYRDPQDVIPE